MESRSRKFAPRRKDFSGDSTIYFGFTSPSLDTQIEGDNGSIDYEPNVNSRTTIGYSYKRIGTSIAFNNPTSASSRDQKGHSHMSDFQFRYYWNRITGEIFFQNYRGYYITNTTSFNPSATNYIQHENLKSRHYAVQAYYTFQPQNFSMSSTFDLTDRPLKTGGSWLALAGLHRNELHDDIPLVPASASADYASIADWSDGIFTTLNIEGGGAYNWVWRNFFIGGALFLGPCFQYQAYSTQQKETHAFATALCTNAKVSTGYHGKKYFFVLQANSDSMGIRLEGVDIRQNALDSGIIFGMHF